MAELMLASRSLPFAVEIYPIDYVEPAKLTEFVAEHLQGYEVTRTIASDSMVEFAEDQQFSFTEALLMFHYAIVVRPLVGETEAKVAIAKLPPSKRAISPKSSWPTSLRTIYTYSNSVTLTGFLCYAVGMKSAAFFDFDRTLYNGFSYFDLLEKQTNEGLLTPDVSHDAVDALGSFIGGEVTYEETVVTLLDIYAGGLKGVRYEAVAQSTRELFRGTDKVYPFAGKVFHLLRSSHGLYLATAEPQFVGESIEDLYGLDGQCSTEFEVDKGILTSAVASYLASRDEKRDAVLGLMEGHTLDGSFALGDSAGDIGMLAVVQNPICVSADDELKAHATLHGWTCVEPDEVEAAVFDKLA